MTEPTPVPDEVGGGFRTVALHAASTRPDASSGLPRRDRVADTAAAGARGEPGGTDGGPRQATDGARRLASGTGSDSDLADRSATAAADGKPGGGTAVGSAVGKAVGDGPYRGGAKGGNAANTQFMRSSDPGQATMTPRDFRSGDEVEAGIVALWREYGRRQARELRDRLVLHYAPLVKYVAGRVGTGLPSYVDVSDLIQSGIFGLVDAIEKFEPERGLKFETYAMQRIRGAILDDLRAQDWVPRSVRGRARDVERALERLEARLQRTASDGELAEELGVTLEDLRDLYAQFQLTSVVALDELIVAGRGTASLAETLPDDRAEDPVANLVDRDNRRQLAEAIAQLSERDRVVVTLYYFENLTLAEIGKVLGVTESRVCQLHTRSVLRLRAKLVEPAEA